MNDRIKRALELWPHTKAEDWTMRGGTAVHKDATVTVPDANLTGGFIRSGMVTGDAWVSGGEVSGDAWVSGDALVSGDAWVSGGEVSGGKVTGGKVTGSEWASSPPAVQGSRHYANAASHTEIAIGCEVHEVGWWREHYKAVGREHGYTAEQIEEYGRIIEFIAGELEHRFGEARNERG